ncbi:MAG TPA: hypothetical protein DDY91_21890 [Planctomycetaceae bacterium]|nr:hypothetical protein [Planctomycetaceae bacterium]
MSLVGMLLGGLFGWGAGALTPSFFARIQPWGEVEPQGFAIVLGAFGGVLCGGALGTFALILELVAQKRGLLRDPPHST